MAEEEHFLTSVHNPKPTYDQNDPTK